MGQNILGKGEETKGGRNKIRGGGVEEPKTTGDPGKTEFGSMAKWSRGGRAAVLSF